MSEIIAGYSHACISGQLKGMAFTCNHWNKRFSNMARFDHVVPDTKIFPKKRSVKE